MSTNSQDKAVNMSIHDTNSKPRNFGSTSFHLASVDKAIEKSQGY